MGEHHVPPTPRVHDLGHTQMMGRVFIWQGPHLASLRTVRQRHTPSTLPHFPTWPRCGRYGSDVMFPSGPIVLGSPFDSGHVIMTGSHGS
jgi:hypothetical protein